MSGGIIGRDMLARHAALALMLLAGLTPAVAQSRASRPAADTLRTGRGSTIVAGETVSLLGLGVSFSGTDRDTLGVLVASITPGGPAEQAGINQGNRLAEINGVNLRLDAADVGQPGASDLVFRRLSRAMRAVRSGGEISVRAYSGGRYRSVTIQTTKAPVIRLSAAEPDSSHVDKARAPALTAVLASMGELRGQLRRLAQTEEQSPLVDTIMQVALDLGALQNRLRDAQLLQQAASAAPKRGSVVDPAAWGLRVVAVSPEMASYFGEGSEHGLLVTEADSSFAPIRKGDVILRIDGNAVKVDGIREALDSGREERVDLLRGGRLISVMVHPRE
jgi:S1-C subfamily serine protease